MIRTDAPTGPHVVVYPSGDRGGGINDADSWHRYKALYGESYNWDHPTPAEIAARNAEDAYVTEHGCYPP